MSARYEPHDCADKGTAGISRVASLAVEVVVEITAIDRSAQPHTAPVAIIAVDQAAENREVIRAVKALNATEMFGQENQLLFRRDPESQRMVVRVVNRKTEEVVSQIPAEYILRLAEDLKPKPATRR